MRYAASPSVIRSLPYRGRRHYRRRRGRALWFGSIEREKPRYPSEYAPAPPEPDPLMGLVEHAW